MAIEKQGDQQKKQKGKVDQNKKKITPDVEKKPRELSEEELGEVEGGSSACGGCGNACSCGSFH